MNVILQAAAFAADAHKTQKRKWTGRPFVEHPMRVAGRVTLLDDSDEEVVAAAWLHDVFEDCPEHIAVVRGNMPERVVKFVDELTNPSKRHPKMPRKDRKMLDRLHYHHASVWAKRIKLIDRLDNVRDMQGCEAGFRRLYLDETLLLANVLLDHTDPVNKTLYLELMTELGLSLV